MGAGETQMKILITGAGGFLGGALARKLVKTGRKVRSFSRKQYPHLEKLGIEHIRGDLADPEAVSAAVKSCQAVFHVAAKAGIWGSYDEYYRTNVLGTKNVIEACRQHNVKKLVYTSSPSVIFKSYDQEGVDESESYPKNFLSPYPRTKAEAEKMVLEACDDNLLTVSLRPHLIWGPGDNHIVPRIIDRAKKNKLQLVGDGTNLVDTVYIDNAVQAHLLALEKLTPNSPICGKAYFITDHQPMSVSEIMNRILKAAGLPPVRKKIPFPAAYAAGAFTELIYRLLGKKEEPLMTRFLAKELSRAHWFDNTAARRDLGYEPKVSIDEGMKKLADWLQGRKDI